MGRSLPTPPLPPSGEYPEAWIWTRAQRVKVIIANMLVFACALGFVGAFVHFLMSAH